MRCRLRVGVRRRIAGGGGSMILELNCPGGGGRDPGNSPTGGVVSERSFVSRIYAVGKDRVSFMALTVESGSVF
jgi:hypothetical protein